MTFSGQRLDRMLGMARYSGFVVRATDFQRVEGVRHEDTFQSDIDIAVVARTNSAARHLGDSLRKTLTPIAARSWVRPNVLPCDCAEILALPAEDATMWKNLSRDAIALHGSAPRALLARLEKRQRP